MLNYCSNVSTQQHKGERELPERKAKNERERELPERKAKNERERERELPERKAKNEREREMKKGDNLRKSVPLEILTLHLISLW